jgi:hypothetical protein
MSGSGATVFGVFPSAAHAEDGAKRLAASLYRKASGDFRKASGEVSEDAPEESACPTDRAASGNEYWIRVTEVITASV